MEDIDMSRPGSELFPESQGPLKYNSYQDVNVQGHNVDDPLNTGVKSPYEDAVQGQPVTDKEMNFRALGEVVTKLKEEREYWKGQAEAYSRVPSHQPEVAKVPESENFNSLDWNDGGDVRKAFDSLRGQNESLRNEIRDTLAAVSAKSQHQDWNNMVTQHVPELTSKNPIFAEMIQKASNPYEAAYLLAELNARASQPVAQQPPPYQQMNGNAQRAIANAQKPQSLASVGGSGTLSNADYYASMSDEDFGKIASRNMANI